MHRSARVGGRKDRPVPAMLLRKSKRYDRVLSTLDTGRSASKARRKPGEDARGIVALVRGCPGRELDPNGELKPRSCAAKSAILRRMDEPFDRMRVSELYRLIVDAEEPPPSSEAATAAAAEERGDGKPASGE